MTVSVQVSVWVQGSVRCEPALRAALRDHRGPRSNPAVSPAQMSPDALSGRLNFFWCLDAVDSPQDGSRRAR